jgi:hypothetical protein
MKEKIKVRNKKLHLALVKILLKSPVKDIKITKQRIALSFFNHRIADKIKIARENHVAEWSRKRREIFIDRGFGKKEEIKSFRALCIHELIESFLVKEFGFKLDEEAHIVATQKEKEYLERVKGNWKSHELKVFWDWHKLGEH